MPMSDPGGVLIMGGTSEAVALARELDRHLGPAVRIVSSLAGRTRAPADVPGEVRVGGFGGANALAEYLRREGFSALIDATHPFAAQISANAYIASEACGIAYLRIERPAWTPADGDNWQMAASAADAASLLPGLGQRAFLTVGRRDLEAFSACPDTWFLVRLVDIPPEPLPLARCEVIAARGPFAVDEEIELLDCHEIDVLVCKASGGDMTAAKLTAARRRNIPVIMIARPPESPGRSVANVDLAVEWFLDLHGRMIGAGVTGRNE